MAHEKDFKEKLIAAVKKEVKQVMEESVTRKFVHEESGSVTSLCGAVEACLSQGLRRRALGLFKTSSTTALLHKIAKHSPEAARISKRVQELENVDNGNRRSSSSSDSLTKPQLKKHASLSSVIAPLPKYLWIRLALFEKQLAKIIDYLVSNANRYYEKDALVADPDYGTILSSLLVGPCALDYTRMRSLDNFCTDPPADELVQRHRISSAGVGGGSTPPSNRRHPMQPNFRRSLNASSEDTLSSSCCSRSSAHQLGIARDYVESLHQNSRATLLFGKNNVTVMPSNASSNVQEPMPGYLSLHQTAHGLTIKWTPNQLMNGFVDETQDKSVYWDYALHVRLDEIVYVHCHQESDTGGTVILVGQDGVQRPPIHFPKGGHMLAFLSCIETGLLPRGRLDPPLWSQRSSGGGAVGKNNNKRRRPLPALAPDTTDTNTETTRDYVFRIIDNSDHTDMPKRTELMDTRAHLGGSLKTRVQLASTSTSSDSSCKSFSIEQQHSASATADEVCSGGVGTPPVACIRAVCDSMKRQIISRAFYGWLAYCRHLSTVRTHLSGLVNANIVLSDERDEQGITEERWSEVCVDGVVSDYAEVYRLTYFGGIAHSLRKEIWPYLLGHYKFGTTQQQRNELAEETKQAYENTMSEWLAVEAIVRQRDKENQAQAHAKLSTGSAASTSVNDNTTPPPPPHSQQEHHLSNEVFEDELLSDDEHESMDEEEEACLTEAQPVKKTRRNTIKYESGDDENEDENEATVAGVTPIGKYDHDDDGEEAQRSPDNREFCCSNIEHEPVNNGESICDYDNDLVNDTVEQNQEQIFPPDDTCYTEEMKDFIHNVIVTNASVDMSNLGGDESRNVGRASGGGNLDAVTEENNSSLDTCIETHGLASPARSACASPASSNGGVYTLRVGAPGHRLHAGHVRPGGPVIGHLQRGIGDVRLLLSPDGANGGKFPERPTDGLSLCEYALAHSDPRCGNVRTDASTRRLHALLLLLQMVPVGFQARAGVRGCERHLGSDLGGATSRFTAFRAVHRTRPARDIQRHHPFKWHGLHRYHQIL
ncbi:unnamed protein product [Acanthoscelides obtectus]|uniref:RUN domain-containing protein n=1 Tax=Acanthoscelides obtectus TaxID=200917 RepID=A0A9P0LEH9_ACAOB|nr:unnamed protein product [Acanthoscelides obtectus]CAK1664594.1 Small G protein signaling modulator 1 [Acanthoscelides obtectus]